MSITTTTDTLVTLEKVTKTYTMGEVVINALNGIDLAIKRGEFLAVLGPSGSGKTTLLNMLGGIDSPTSGRIVVDGEDITNHKRKQLTYYRREKVGFIFQFFNLIPTLTAVENVRYAWELAARDGGAPNTRPEKLLEAVGIGDRANHFPSQMSGGEQQRVAVARALAKDPVMILGDEPTGNLDFRMGKLVLGSLKELNDRGKTVVLVTHNSPIAAIADRVLHIRDGVIFEEEINEHPTPADEIVW
ncbi:MAG: ABC transporter ATP-binding protein [Coriobacteriia bacterium]|nr:ABC transporter ATP-binding protein [Coriobacteriia bacterium]